MSIYSHTGKNGAEDERRELLEKTVLYASDEINDIRAMKRTRKSRNIDFDPISSLQRWKFLIIGSYGANRANKFGPLKVYGTRGDSITANNNERNAKRKAEFESVQEAPKTVCTATRTNERDNNNVDPILAAINLPNHSEPANTSSGVFRT